jgi:NAD(P)-dependent dehydrogenase (short-subunit alcohol dehydrogenase family)
MKLRNSVALITGASRGLGLEVARLYAAGGARLILTARTPEPLEAAARELSLITEVLAIPTDVSQMPQVDRLVEAGLARFGRIDVLVNNASALGPSPMPALDRYPVEDLLQVFAANVGGPLRLIQRVLPDMRWRGEGVILNVSSDAGVNAYAGWGGYGASKAGLEHLTRTFAAELEGSGVRIYAVDPGDMDTQMHRDAEPGADLSHLPGPSVSAPAFVHLVERETAPTGRFEAQSLALAPV